MSLERADRCLVGRNLVPLGHALSFGHFLLGPGFELENLGGIESLLFHHRNEEFHLLLLQDSLLLLHAKLFDLKLGVRKLTRLPRAWVEDLNPLDLERLEKIPLDLLEVVAWC